MSDNVLKFIPVDPELVPPESRQRDALNVLVKAFPDGDDAQIETYDRVTFIDNGVNTSAIICSRCGGRLPLEGDENADLFSWILGDEDPTPISARLINMPCCKATVRAVSLSFDWPAGFARFELSIWNPQTERPVDSAIRRSLEEALGCSVQEIWAHY